jgi:hypothetical protein
MSSEPAPAAAPPSFFAILSGLYFAPSEAFRSVAARPAFALPLIGALLLSVMFTAVWVHKTDFREFMRAQLDQSPQAANMPAEQRAAVLDQQAAFMQKGGAWIGPPVVVVMVAVFAGALLFVFRFFYAGNTTFAQAMAVTSWSFFAVGLLTNPLMLLVLFLKDDWTLNPGEVLQANPTLFFERTDLSSPLYSFLSSLDLFSFWLMWLLAAEFAATARVRPGAAIWGVIVPWVLYVLIKVGLAALF